MKLPFKFFPASWGLVGDAYAEAEAYYLLKGEKLDRRLMVIRYKNEPDVLAKKLLDIDLRYFTINEYQYDSKINELLYEHDVDGGKLSQIDIDLKHKKITDYEAATKKLQFLHKEGMPLKLALVALDLEFNKITAYEAEIAKAKLLYKDNSKEYRFAVIDIKLQFGRIDEYDAEIAKLNIKYPGEDKAEAPLEKYKIEKLEIDHKFHKIPSKQYEKQKATLENRAWVDFVDSEFDPDKGVDGFYFEMDWNAQFIEYLTLHGFVGHTEEQIVEDWFDELCKSHTKDNFTPPNPGLYPMGYDPNA